MGKFDDELWDLNPNSNNLPSLHRPRSSKNNTVNGLMMNLFSAEKTGIKTRPKTIHVYGMDNKEAGNDLLDLISRSKANSKSSKGPLQEKNINTSRPDSAKTIDLLDIDVLLSSQSQKTVPIEDGINLLHGGHDFLNEPMGLDPHRLNAYEIDELQSQISTVTLENEDPVKRATTLPIIGLAPSSGCVRLTKSAELAGNDEESVADSEEEPELLSTTLSSQSRIGSRSSTVNLFDQNRTFDTSILEGQEKVAYDDTLVEAAGSESQLTNVNIQAEDFVMDDFEVFNIKCNTIESPNEGGMEYLDETLDDNKPESQRQACVSTNHPKFTNNVGDTHKLSNICDKINGKVLHDISSDLRSEDTQERTGVNSKDIPLTDNLAKTNIPAPVLPPSYPSNRERKRKTSLADICSKTNRARLPPRVGLSKKLKVDSLHDYLKK